MAPKRKAKRDEGQLKSDDDSGVGQEQRSNSAAKRSREPASKKGQAENNAEDAKNGGEPSTSKFMQYDAYLMKSEPEELSIDALIACPNSTDPWTGVRNAQARNIMRGMKLGAKIFFYHSSCKVPGIVGEAVVVREAYPDHTAWDPKSKYYDERSAPENPKWWMVDVKFVRKLDAPVTLEQIKAEAARVGPPLADMMLLKRSRLSVQGLTEAQWQAIVALEARNHAAQQAAGAQPGETKAEAQQQQDGAKQGKQQPAKGKQGTAKRQRKKTKDEEKEDEEE